MDLAARMGELFTLELRRAWRVALLPPIYVKKTTALKIFLRRSALSQQRA